MRRFTALCFAVSALGCAKAENPPPSTEVEIIGSDYAFTAPATIPAGRATFRFRNTGKVRHELNVARLKTGVTVEKYLATIRANETVQPLIEGPVGVLFAAPGATSDAGLAVDVQAGENYAVICIFTDSAGAKRHYDLGMYTTIAVEGSNVAPLPRPATDTIVATDYAFQYTRTVPPGARTFVMRNEGKQRHQLSIVMLRPGVTFQRVQEAERSGASVDSLFEGEFGLLHSYGGRNPLGGLTISMAPGREYVIACFFQDHEKAPEHYALGMFGSIRVAESPSDSTSAN